MSFIEKAQQLSNIGLKINVNTMILISKHPQTGVESQMQAFKVDAGMVSSISKSIIILVDGKQVAQVPYANSHTGHVGETHVAVSYYFQKKDEKAVEDFKNIGTKPMIFSTIAIVMLEELKPLYEAGRIKVELTNEHDDYLNVIFDCEAKFIPGQNKPNFMVNLLPSRDEQLECSKLTKSITQDECLTTSPATGCKPILYHSTLTVGKIDFD